MSDDPRRNVELAAIHVAKKQLGLDDDVYRAIVARISTKFRRAPLYSSGDMEPRERRALIEELRRLGFQKKPEAKKVERPQVGKVYALWKELQLAGALRDSSVVALRHFVKRVTGRDALQWATPGDLNKVIEALKAWLARVLANANA